MNLSHLHFLLGLLLTVAGVVGCTDGGAVAFRQEEPDNLLRSLVATATQSASEEHGMESDRDTLVSMTSAHPTARPSLITLPKGGDLRAQVNGADGPVLLDFFADWCGPCRAQGKILHDLEQTASKTQTLIIKINVDEHPQLAQELGVSSLPTLMMIKDGEIVRRQSGVAPKDRLVAWMR